MESSVRLATLLLVATALAGCFLRTRCTVSNHSSSTLSHIVVSGKHFSVSVPDLAPGQSRSVVLSPRGEEGTLSIVFRVDGREFRHTEATYFEASGYEVTVNVGTEFHVTTHVGVAGSSGSSRTPPAKGAS